MADIRSFFGRKRKSTDSGNDRCVGPAAKKRKVSTKTESQSTEENDCKNNDENSNTANNEAICKQEVVPSIEHLDIKPTVSSSTTTTTKREDQKDADYDPSTDTKMEDIDEYESIEEEPSDDDDDLNATSLCKARGGTLRKVPPTPSVASSAISKIK